MEMYSFFRVKKKKMFCRVGCPQPAADSTQGIGRRLEGKPPYINYFLNKGQTCAHRGHISTLIETDGKEFLFFVTLCLDPGKNLC